MSAAPPPTGFLVLHGNRLEDLRQLVVDFLRNSPPPPLVPEVFLVQSNGMKHWLEQGLAHDVDGLGICAGTQIELPSSFLWQAYRAVLGSAAVPAHLPFDKQALVWRLFRLLATDLVRDARFAPLQHYLADDGDGRRRFQLAQQVADVLDGYQQYRADWLAAWEQGDDSAVDADNAWQPALWRALREDVGVVYAQTSRAAVHAAFESAMRALPADAPRPAGLPPRLVVFGISALPLQTVRALAELGRVCQVLMVVQNPCRYHWAHVVEDRELLARLARHRLPLRADLALHDEAPALLASWGKQGRDYLHLLDEFDETETHRHLLARAEVFTDPVELAREQGRPVTRLARLQSAILNLDPPPQLPEPLDDDGSLMLVTAHSAQREVEVLHDRLLALLDADATLTPRDILVMVPEMSGFTAHIQAVFGRFAREHPRHLPYSIADTTPREQPLVKALERLLHLPESRITFADWLALFEVPAVRRRFGLGDADVEALRGWLDDAVVRWGLDGPHRVALGLPADMASLEQNSWASGLRRLLLGYAVAGDTPWENVLPVPGIGGLGAARIGALAQWLDATEATLQQLRDPKSPADWAATLNPLLAQYFDDSDEADARTLRRLREQLETWQGLCDAAQLQEPLPLAVVRDHWLAQMETAGLGQRFFGGGVQFATLMPMRSIPFRVVCLLGMNDGDYPRRAQARDFDLMTTSWRPGDRSRREDDRYLFLEALLCARERVVISWVGHRATDNVALPPSVVVGQLQDELKRRFTPVEPPVPQPLQPFSREYFDPATSTYVTYDADWQRGAQPPVTARVQADATQPLPVPERVALAELTRLLRAPVEVYWRSRLRLRVDEPQDAVPEDEPFLLDRLEAHQAAGDYLEIAHREGPDAAARQLRLSGRLPIGAAGEQALQGLERHAAAVLRHAAPWLTSHSLRRAPLGFQVMLDGFTVEGAVDGLYEADGSLLQRVLRPGALRHKRGNALAPRHHVLLSQWATQVCLAAAGHPLQTVFCGADTTLCLAPLAVEDAQQILRGWLRAYTQAWAAPLPVARRTALDYLTPKPQDEEAAADTFDGGWGRKGERLESAYLRRSFEDYSDIAQGIATWAETLYGALIRACGPEASP